MVKLQLIGAAILLLGMLYIIRLIRKRRMELKYALPWLAVSFAALIVDCFPKLLSVLADLLGIATPVNALYLVAFLFSVCLIFALTVIVSRQSERIKQLVQAVALCEERIRRLEGGDKDRGSGKRE
ncbi:MAG: DUF2304 domain-containing protein [Clostridium sp.]|nr:DUF2304 domain-containing protein [Clostridium sp.]